LQEKEVKELLRKNWAKLSIDDIQLLTKESLYDLLTLGYELNLARINTTHLKKTMTRWSEDEDRFLRDNSNKLTIPEASNLLNRSKYAVYQRVKLLQLPEMVSKRSMGK
jgi:hypothetical protein